MTLLQCQCRFFLFGNVAVDSHVQAWEDVGDRPVLDFSGPSPFAHQGAFPGQCAGSQKLFQKLGNTLPLGAVYDVPDRQTTRLLSAVIQQLAKGRIGIYIVPGIVHEKDGVEAVFKNSLEALPAFLENLFGPQPIGNVLSGTEHAGQGTRFIQHELAAGMDMADRSVQVTDANTALERLMILQSLSYHPTEHFPVVGMDAFHHASIGQLQLLGRPVENTVELLGSGYGIARHLPVPAAYLCQALGLRQQRLTAAQLLLNLFAQADILANADKRTVAQLNAGPAHVGDTPVPYACFAILPARSWLADATDHISSGRWVGVHLREHVDLLGFFKGPSQYPFPFPVHQTQPTIRVKNVDQDRDVIEDGSQKLFVQLSYRLYCGTNGGLSVIDRFIKLSSQ